MYEWSFDESGDIILAIKNGLKVYQLKEIRSGDIIECEISPRWDTKLEKKSIRKHLTPERQRKHNEKVAADKIRRKANANFGEDDLEVTLTYKGSQPSMEQAQKDIRNYLLRLKRFRKKQGLPDLKYIYVIEAQTSEGTPSRVHHHLLLPGDMNRDDVEKLWNKGRANTVRLQPDEDGIMAIATYIAKNRKKDKFAKRWGCSRNLKEPEIRRTTRIGDYRLNSRRKIEKLSQDFESIFKRAYPNHAITLTEVKTSQYVGGIYIYVRLRRITP